jgi:TfoX/Sxy family transcriptional regulator of competence genes
MSWGKSSASVIERFERLLGDHPKVERRTMFGFPIGSANGNYFVGLHENRFLLRLGESDHAAFVNEFGATFFEPMPGRKSRHTLVVPERVAADPALLGLWYEKALAHALSLPAKKAKKKAPAKKVAAKKAVPKKLATKKKAAKKKK